MTTKKDLEYLKKENTLINVKIFIYFKSILEKTLRRNNIISKIKKKVI